MAIAAKFCTAVRMKDRHGFLGFFEDPPAVVCRVDSIIDAFAEKRALACSADYYHDLPERSLVWGNGIRRLIRMSLECKGFLTFRMALCATQDRGSRRFCNQASLWVDLIPDQLKAELPGLLAMAYQRVDSWQEPSLAPGNVHNVYYVKY